MQVNMKPRPVGANNTMFAFITPIFVKQHEGTQEMNEAIKAFVLADRAKSLGEQASNRGGWHSSRDLLQRLGEPHAPRLGQMFFEGIKTVMGMLVENADFSGKAAVECWANVNEKGDWNESHIHPNCPWSGVYYPATDTRPEAGGAIRFTEPRIQALMLAHPLNPFHATNNVRIRPVPGMMVVFPSFLYHAVDPYLGEEPRISIAINLH
ncbi:MAG: TIGR02466 family protein [Phycisphaerae bacterium]